MADVSLEITVKDAHVTRALAALNGYEGKTIAIVLQNDGKPGQTVFSLTYPAQGETGAKVFAENVLKSLFRGFVRCYELKQDTDRYNTEIDAVEAPSQDLPDGIVE